MEKLLTCVRKLREERRKDVEKMNTDEWENRPFGSSTYCSSALYSLLSHAICYGSSPPPLSHPPFLFHIVPIFQSCPLSCSLSALQTPLFIPSSLSLSVEARVHSICHRLPKFIWSAGLVPVLCSCCCCSEAIQLYPISNKQINLQIRLFLCFKLGGDVLGICWGHESLCRNHKGILCTFTGAQHQQESLWDASLAQSVHAHTVLRGTHNSNSCTAKYTYNKG